MDNLQTSCLHRKNAFAKFKEKEKGTLTTDILADLAVLSQDIFTIPADQLPATTSILTMIDGKIVYERPLQEHINSTGTHAGTSRLYWGNQKII